MGNSEDFLMHWGIRGMKWGQRLYQNKDGTLTPLGRKHYGTGNKLEKLSLEDIAKTAQKLKVINEYRSQIAAYKKFRKENSFIGKLKGKFSDKTVDMIVNSYDKSINGLLELPGKTVGGLNKQLEKVIDNALNDSTDDSSTTSERSSSSASPRRFTLVDDVYLRRGNGGRNRW